MLALVRGAHELAAPHRARGLGRAAAAACSTRRWPRPGSRRAVADVAQILLAGADLPAEERALHEALAGARLGARDSRSATTRSRVLRAGTERGWGVAVVCGAGINCVGVAPGRPPRALPRARGDHRRLGRRLRRRPRGARRGGAQRGRARAADLARARGARALRPRRRRSELAEAMHLGGSRSGGVIELAPVVLAEARADAVAAGLVDRLARRGRRAGAGRAGAASGCTSARSRCCWAAGCCAARRRRRSRRPSRAGAWAPRVRCARDGAPPIVGAALLALDELGAGGEAQARAAPRARRRGPRSDREADLMAEVRFEQATRDLPGHRRAGASTRSTWTIGDGELMVLVGPSGSGKIDRAADARRARGGRRRGRLHRRPRRHRRSRRRAATWRWCSRTTRSTRT